MVKLKIKPFGAIAVEKGYVSKEQVAKALEIQRKEVMEGTGHRLIGAILCDMGLMTVSQILEVLESS
jgi:hypothetical protein